MQLLLSSAEASAPLWSNILSDIHRDTDAMYLKEREREGEEEGEGEGEGEGEERERERERAERGRGRVT